MNQEENATTANPLKRELGVFGAVMMGLGSIIGTGVFVSIGIAAGITGPAVIFSVIVAAGLATCNALSSAQLAANHPVSGGTYEYGYQYLTPKFGFIAGWLFLCAKSASAATAALGFAGYLMMGLKISDPTYLVPIALAATALLTLVVLSGLTRANWANILIVSLTLSALGLFVILGVPTVLKMEQNNFIPLFDSGNGSAWNHMSVFLHASAMMFVAFTGYGRIATLGEEVREPEKTIPRAIVTTLVLSATIYIAVSWIAIGTVGADKLGHAAQSSAAPLEIVAKQFSWSYASWWLSLGAVTAMLGVLLNLIIGLSRVLLAMGRRHDVPQFFTRLTVIGRTPWVSTIAIGLIVAALASTGDIKTTWSFSAFTVLIYYAITNLAALQLKPENRLYHPVFPWTGLMGCLGLACWVEWKVWLAGTGIIFAGLVFQGCFNRKPTTTP